MAVTEVQTADLAQIISGLLDGVQGLRTYPYVSDAVRPPAVVVMLPTVDYLDEESGFCSATFTYPLTLVVARSNDRDAQAGLSRYLQVVTSTLDNPAVPGVLSMTPAEARPITVTVSGQELPGYAITVRVRA